MAKLQGGVSNKFEVELFDGKNNFNLWQSTVKDILVQQGLIKALNGKEKRPVNMTDEAWEEIDMKAVSMIRLCLAPEVKYNVLDETCAVDLWKKLEKLYMSKSVTNRLYLKKKLYQLRMDEGTDIRDHLNYFNKLLSQLIGVGVTIDDEDKALLLLASLPDSYHSLVTALSVGKDTLTMEDTISVILENENLRMPTLKSEETAYVVSNGRGRNTYRGGSPNKRVNKSDLRGPMRDYSDKECFYCHKKGHLKWMCKKLNDDIEEFKRIKEKKEVESNTVGIADLQDDEDYVILMNDECQNDLNDCWLFDSACSSHVCADKKMFHTYNDCQPGIMKIANGDTVNVKGIDNVKFKLHDGSIKILKDVRYVPALKKNLISLGKLDASGYGYSAKDGILKITKGRLNIMKGKKTNGNLYKLMGNTIVRNIDDEAYDEVKKVEHVRIPTFAEVLRRPVPVKILK